MFRRVNQRGFTLLEVLVVMFILGFILGPMLQLMGKSYAIVQTSKEEQAVRDDFRLFTSYLLEDLLFASSINVQHKTDEDILSYVAKSGRPETLLFSKNDGLSIIQGGKYDLVTKGEIYEEGLPMVRIDEDGVIRFNFFARPLNVLFVTSVEPRTNEVIK